MKDYLKSAQKTTKRVNKFLKRFYFFRVIIILVLLDIIALVIAFLYIQKIEDLTLPKSQVPYIKIASLPSLPSNLDSVKASAEAYLIYDTKSRSVVAGKNYDLRFSPASTAKIMTATLVLEHYDLNQYLTVPSDIYTIQGSKMGVYAGESLTVKSLLYGMLLPSGNDAAHTLAFYYPGGVEGFVNAMNRKADELDLLNTHFVDPAGYEDGNYTNGIDLARLASYAMQNLTFRQIVKTKNYVVNNSIGTHPFFLMNLNELLEYPNVVGVKTGFTNEAGEVLVTGVEKNGRLLIVVVLKSQNRFGDTKDLMDFINEKIKFSNLDK